MKQFPILLIIFSLFFGEGAYSQISLVEIKLKNEVPKQYQREYPPYIIDDTETLKKFDYKKDPLYDVEFVQYGFWYTDMKGDYHIDTLNAAIYSSPTMGTKVIIDVNKDNDFRNDPEYVFDEPTSCFEVDLPVQIDKYLEGDIKNKSFLLSPVKGEEGMAKIEKFKFIQNWIYKGDFKLNKTEGEIFLRLPFSFDIKAGGYTKHLYKYGETILIDGRLYKTKGDLKKVYFEDIGTVDYTLLPATDYVTKEPFSREDFKGKYVLYDFWGSWCQPCIKGIPDLKNLKEKYGGNLEIISIAYENSSDLSALDKVLKENQMNWYQLYFLKKEKDPEKNGSKYFVKIFPTFVLFDPDGEMMIRVEGNSRLKEIEDILKEEI